jgi:hypothetical protein
MMRYGGVFGFAEWLEIHCLVFRSGFFWVGKSVMWKGKSIERYVWNFRGAFDGMKQHERQGPFIEKAKKKSIWKWIIHILVQFFEKKAALNFEQLGLSETCVPWNRLETHIIIRIISRPWDIPWYTPILDTSNWIWLLRTDMTSARLRHIMLKFQDVFFWDRR